MEKINENTLEVLNDVISYYQSISLSGSIANSRIYEIEKIISGLTAAKFDIARKLSAAK